MSALKEHRKAAGLTQFEVEDKIGVPRRTIEKWERGGSIPPHYVLWLVLKELREVKALKNNFSLQMTKKTVDLKYTIWYYLYICRLKFNRKEGVCND